MEDSWTLLVSRHSEGVFLPLESGGSGRGSFGGLEALRGALGEQSDRVRGFDEFCVSNVAECSLEILVAEEFLDRGRLDARSVQSRREAVPNRVE